MNSQAQVELIKLIVAWTLLGAFVFTVVITCLSLVGLLKFKDKAQQNKMFYVMIVQLAVGCVGFFIGLLQPNPTVTQKVIEAPLESEKQHLLAINEGLESERSKLLKELEVSKGLEGNGAIKRRLELEVALSNLLFQELADVAYASGVPNNGPLRAPGFIFRPPSPESFKQLPETFRHASDSKREDLVQFLGSTAGELTEYFDVLRQRNKKELAQYRAMASYVVEISNLPEERKSEMLKGIAAAESRDNIDKILGDLIESKKKD